MKSLRLLLAMTSLLLPITAIAGVINGFEFVDMGFPSGTKWATCNLGASSPEEYGYYYAWGETVGNSSTSTRDFSWNTYKYCKGTGTTLTRYCTSETYGKVDGKKQLSNYFHPYDHVYINEDGDEVYETENDDAASVTQEYIWLIPTNTQMTELRNNTTAEYEVLNGVKGRRFTSKINGNSIFMPFAGCFEGKEYKNHEIYGNYWTSTLTSNSQQAYGIWFPETGGVRSGGLLRCYAQSIRPVCIPVEKITVSPAEGETRLNLGVRYPNIDAAGTTITVEPKNATNPNFELGGWTSDSSFDSWNRITEFEGAFYIKANEGALTHDVYETFEIKALDGSECSATYSLHTLPAVVTYKFEQERISIPFDANSMYFTLDFFKDVYDVPERWPQRFDSSNPNIVKFGDITEEERIEADPNSDEDGVPISYYHDIPLFYYNGTGTATIVAKDHLTSWGYAEEITSTCEVEILPGKCGENLTYTVVPDEDSGAFIVNISGSGSMYNDPVFSDMIYNSSYGREDSEYCKMQEIVVNFDTQEISSIGDRTFSHCPIKSITIPASVTSIGDEAFAYSGLKTIYLSANVPTISSTTFENVKGLTVYVPNSAIQAYKNDPNWKQLNIQAIPQIASDLIIPDAEKEITIGEECIICVYVDSDASDPQLVWYWENGIEMNALYDIYRIAEGGEDGVTIEEDYPEGGPSKWQRFVYKCNIDDTWGIGTEKLTVRTMDGSNLSAELTITTTAPVNEYSFVQNAVSVPYDPNNRWLYLDFVSADFNTLYNFSSSNPYVADAETRIHKKVIWEGGDDDNPGYEKETDDQYVLAWFNGTGTTKFSTFYEDSWYVLSSSCDIEITPGRCGENLEYTVYHSPEDGSYTVNITGSGSMYNFDRKYFGEIPVDPYTWETADLSVKFNTQEITSIGDYAFSYCTLETIEIPTSVLAIGNYAFSNANIGSIFVGTTIPSVEDNTFEDMNVGTCTLVVPRGMKKAYQNAAGWSLFQNIEESEGDTNVSDLDNAIYVESFESRLGATVDIPIKIKSSYNIKGFQFSFDIPEGITVNGWTLSSDRLPQGATTSNVIGQSLEKDGKFTVAYGLNYNGLCFTGNDGIIGKINITFDENMAVGDYELHLSNCDIANINDEDEDLPDTYSTVTLEKILLGDANQDGKIRIGDVTAILNYIVGKVSGKFSVKAADANNDGKIRIGDATAVLNMIVNQ